MKKKLLKSFVRFAIYAASALLLLLGYTVAKGETSAIQNVDRASNLFEKAKVISVGERTESSDLPDDIEDVDIQFKCKFLSGERKGEIINALQNISNYMPNTPREVAKGDTIIVTHVDDASNSGTWYFAEYVRSDTLLVLLAIFLLALLIFGGMNGIKTIVSLAFTCASVFLMLIPAVYSGQNVYAWAVVVCLYIIVMTLCIVNGISYMSLAAGLGCVFGVLFSSLMIWAADKVSQLTGFVDECSIYLSYIDMNGKVDLRGLVFAAVIIGSVGAVMDVAVDISASLHEIAVKVKTPTIKELCESGFTIGRNIMGTMSNTLILAYIGSSLCFVLLVIYNSSDSALYLFNREIIVVEGLKILIGSIGILMTIPFTSIVCSFLYTRKNFGRTSISEDTPDDKSTSELMKLAKGIKENAAQQNDTKQ